MYFWNTQNLAADLKENKLSERDKVKYYLVFVLFLGFTFPDKNGDTSTNGALLYLFHLILAVAIYIWGIFYVYRQNARGDNAHILDRMVCLMLPLGLRFGATIFGVAIFAAIIIAGFEFIITGDILIEEKMKSPSFGMLNLLFGIIWKIAYFVRLGHWANRVAGPEPISRIHVPERKPPSPTDLGKM